RRQRLFDQHVPAGPQTLESDVVMGRSICADDYGLDAVPSNCLVGPSGQMDARQAALQFPKALGSLIADRHDPRFGQLAEDPHVIDAPVPTSEDGNADPMFTHSVPSRSLLGAPAREDGRNSRE